MTKENVASIINEMKVKYVEYAKEMFKYADLKRSGGDLDYEHYESKEIEAAYAACAIWECVEIVSTKANIYTFVELEDIHSKWELEAKEGVN